MAMNTHRQLGITGNNGSKSMEKLSSGFRINRAGDDAAGLSISEKMRGQIRGLNQASRNSQDAISLIQTAEGALNESHAILQRMRELAVQSANDTNVGADRDALQAEVTQLVGELDRIANQTEFNEKKLLNGGLGGSVTQNAASTTVLAVAGVASVNTSGSPAGTYAITATDGSGGAGTTHLTMTFGGKTQEISNKAGAQVLNFSEFGITVETNAGYTQGAGIGNVVVTAGSAVFQIGANKGQNISLSIADMTANGTELGLSGINISTQSDANNAIETINNALTRVSEERSNLGAVQNRLEHTIKNLDNTSENLQAAESRIRDVDMAKEMMEFTKNNILQQAAQSMLAQANQAPQGVLQLLR